MDCLLGAAQGARQGYFGDVMGKKCGNQRVIRGGDRLLRLHYLNIVGHARREPVPCLNERRCLSSDLAWIISPAIRPPSNTVILAEATNENVP